MRRDRHGVARPGRRRAESRECGMRNADWSGEPQPARLPPQSEAEVRNKSLDESVDGAEVVPPRKAQRRKSDSSPNTSGSATKRKTIGGPIRLCSGQAPTAATERDQYL